MSAITRIFTAEERKPIIEMIGERARQYALCYEYPGDQTKAEEAKEAAIVALNTPMGTP